MNTRVSSSVRKVQSFNQRHSGYIACFLHNAKVFKMKQSRLIDCGLQPSPENRAGGHILVRVGVRCDVFTPQRRRQFCHLCGASKGGSDCGDALSAYVQNSWRAGDCRCTTMELKLKGSVSE